MPLAQFNFNFFSKFLYFRCVLFLKYEIGFDILTCDHDVEGQVDRFKPLVGRTVICLCFLGRGGVGSIVT